MKARIAVALITGVVACSVDPDPDPEGKRVFHLVNGTLGKIRDSSDTRLAVDVADEACTTGANRRGLGGAWKAWLSSSGVDAIDRIADVSPWYRLDQTTLLFETKEELTRGPRARIDPTDATCADVATCQFAFWSGTALTGRGTSDNCLDWTEYLGQHATVGRADVAGSSWVAPDRLYCGAYLALLCIEQ
jgi:hypothetical protein